MTMLMHQGKRRGHEVKVQLRTGADAMNGYEKSMKRYGEEKKVIIFLFPFSPN